MINYLFIWTIENLYVALHIMLLTELPVEILELVFRNLCIKDQKNIPLVCKHLYKEHAIMLKIYNISKRTNVFKYACKHNLLDIVQWLYYNGKNFMGCV